MHVHVQFQRGGSATITIDGQDFSKDVLADGFGIEYDDHSRQAVISMRIRPRTLTVEGEVDELPEPLRLLLASPEADA